MYFVLAAVIFSSIAQAAHGKITRCPLTILTDMSGEIKSTGYPDEPYPNNHRCRTVINGQKGHLIEITFRDFQLEKPEEGKRADTLKVIDGRPRKIKQTRVYRGSLAEPFVFLSKSPRVTLVLSTNGLNREKGFYATYRQLKEQNFCEYPIIDRGFGDCTEAGDGSLYHSCKFECYFGFVLDSNSTTFCNTSIGLWERLPKCQFDPEILQICLDDITNENCLYTPDELADHFSSDNSTADDDEMTAFLEELGDELKEIEETDAPAIGRNAGKKQLKCPKFLCLYNATAKKFKVNCHAFAALLKKRKKLTEQQSTKAMLDCFKCQNANCKTVYI